MNCFFGRFLPKSFFDRISERPRDEELSGAAKDIEIIKRKPEAQTTQADSGADSGINSRISYGIYHSTYHSTPESVPEFVAEPERIPKLPPQASKIFQYLAERRQGFVSARKIMDVLGIPLNTIYKMLIRLRELGCIQYKKENGQYKGFVFKVNFDSKICLSDNGYQSLYQSSCESLYQSNSGKDSGIKKSHISSSSYIERTTTETDRIESELGSNPELGYWRQKGLRDYKENNLPFLNNII